jgi:uncharacterized ion transporter superfamily protein YfcC
MGRESKMVRMKINFMTVVVIIIAIVTALYFIIDSFVYDSRIQKMGINGKITEISRSHGRLTVYFDNDKSKPSNVKFKLSEDIKVGYSNYFYSSTFSMMFDENIQIGDSVSKDKGNLILKVFKKDGSDKYHLFKTFNGN